MTRQLEIIFHGMMCFDPVRGGGFRVLLPDGRDVNHAAGIWVRRRKKTAAARWPWFTLLNDFYFEPSEIEVTETKKSKLDTRNFDGFLTNLKDCDPTFKIARNPEVIGTLRHVNRGILSAHVINQDGQIVVKWKVDVADRARVRIAFGQFWIEPDANTDQVVVANVGISGLNADAFANFVGPFEGSSTPVFSTAFEEMGHFDQMGHFDLYRKLSTQKGDPLPFKMPSRMPPARGAVLIEPSDWLELETPNVKCSPVRSH